MTDKCKCGGNCQPISDDNVILKILSLINPQTAAEQSEELDEAMAAMRMAPVEKDVQEGSPVDAMELPDPKYNMIETEGGDLQVVTALPGRDIDDIDIKIEGNDLIIVSDKEFDHKGRWLRKEFVLQPVSIVIGLPVDGVDVENVKASFSKGILSVTVPRKVVKVQVDIEQG